MEAKGIFQDYEHIIIPSKSHQKDKHGIVCDRYRVVLRLSNSITNRATYEATWKSLFDQFPFIDKAAKDCSRFYYLCPHQPFSINNVGKTITPIPKTKVELPITKQHSGHFPKGELSRSTLNFLSFGAKDGDWNNSLFKAAKDFQQNHYTKDQFIDRAEKITGILDSQDLSTIASAFQSGPQYEPRGDMNDGLRKFILSSHLIVDQQDQSHYLSVNLNNGDTRDIDQSVIRSILRDDFGEYSSRKKVFASFDYLPHSHALLAANEDQTFKYNCYRAPQWKILLFFSGDLTGETKYSRNL
ncbi:MAG: hypothetical protein IPK04_15630 [Bdellovibrionales bacterium]|nr:hypothetical protein [Bdellovibrionales bacterium]